MRSLKKPVLVNGQIMVLLVKGILIAGTLGYFFYRTAIAVIPMMIPAVLFLMWETKVAARNGQKRLLEQFGECILAVGNAMSAGYAAENAFVESIKDMEMMFGRDVDILKELYRMKGGLENHEPLEKLLMEMGARTDIKEIKDFGEVFAITKRNGGSAAEVIRMSAENIRAKANAEEDIRTVLISKRLEQRIMCLMPFFLILYLEATTPGYFDMFYGNLSGILLMTLFLVWYIAAFCLGEYVFYQALGSVGGS